MALRFFQVTKFDKKCDEAYNTILETIKWDF